MLFTLMPRVKICRCYADIFFFAAAADARGCQSALMLVLRAPAGALRGYVGSALRLRRFR